MIPGPYAICAAEFPDDDSDAPIYRTLVYGFDTASQAYAAAEETAPVNSVSPDDVVVIRHIDREEADRFVD